ncbi:hypothetical protein Scep_028565 [Stephania cephalantha]|uniref:NADH:ubiquinone reductase (non-electrogenic) n=1 Tax=Stephania cephalantha TaxID=152367 RepID=A0AAP0EHI0_9MAGN
MRGFSFFERASRAFKQYPSLSKVLVLVSVSGVGLVAYSDSSSPHVTQAASEGDRKKKKVVVLGTGWAGTNFLKNIKNGEIRFLEAECFKIDPTSKKVHCRSTQETDFEGKEEFIVDYDYLVVAMGARSNTFNTPGVVENCHFLKEIEDAQNIRRSVIDCFERANLPCLSDEERKKHLHFVVVGGGPTEASYQGIPKILKVLPCRFDKRITSFAEEKFQRDGINVKLGSMVVKVTDKDISTKERSNGQISSVPYGMVVWSTGIGTRRLSRNLCSKLVRYPTSGTLFEEQRDEKHCGSSESCGSNGADELDIEKFKTILSQVDTQMKILPATAQVASQEANI